MCSLGNSWVNVTLLKTHLTLKNNREATLTVKYLGFGDGDDGDGGGGGERHDGAVDGAVRVVGARLVGDTRGQLRGIRNGTSINLSRWNTYLHLISIDSKALSLQIFGTINQNLR